MMNLFKISIIFIFFFNASSNGQSQLTGRMYKAEISASCKEMSDGGCMIYSYCILEFKKNIVTVSYSTKAYCSPEEKEGNYNRNHSEKMQYGYSIKNNLVVIKSFKTYGKLKIKKKKLIGQKEIDNNEFSKLEFLQQ